MQVPVLVRIARTASVVVAFVFCAIGVAVTPPPLLLFWGVLGVAIGVAVWKVPDDLPVMRKLQGLRTPTPRTGVRTAVGFVALCLVITGMITTVGALTTATLVVLSAVTAVWVRRLFRHVPNSPNAREVEVLTTPVSATLFEPIAPARALPTEELCLAWRRSYLQLQRAADDHTRQQIIRARQAYLDELERRDGTGFTQWLAGGARAGSDPRRYFTAE